MNALLKQIQLLEVRFSRLMERNRLAKEEIEGLKEDNKRLKQKIENLEKELVQKEEENTSLKSANAILGSSTYVRDTKLKINSIIREIDNCVIALTKENDGRTTEN